MSGYTVQRHPAPAPQCESGFYSHCKHGKSRRVRLCLLCARVISLCGEVETAIFQEVLLFFLPSPSQQLASPGTAECAFRLGSRRDCEEARAHMLAVRFEFLREVSRC